MTLNEAFKNYALNDGLIIRLEFDFTTKKLDLELQLRKHIVKQKYEPCKMLFRFLNVKLFDITEDFPTNGQYSDITICEIQDKGIYASFDPYDNSGQPHEKDNWIIKADSLSIMEIKFK